MARGGGPEAFGNHNQLRLLPGLNQAVGILMMGKVGAARPPDKTDVGKAPRHPVVLIACAGVFQGLNDAGNRDFFHRVYAARYAALHGGQHRGAARGVAAVGKVVRKTKTAAGRANLPQHRRQRHQHPVFLLAKLLALHAPAGHQHGGVFVEKFRQFADFIRRYAANCRRPFGGFGDAIAFTTQIAGENVITAGTTGEEFIVLPAMLYQGMGDPQHQRDVSAHMWRDPFHRFAKEINAFRSHRIDTDQPLAALAQAIKPGDPLFIRGVPGDFQRIQRISAPQHHHLAVLQDKRPAGLLLINFITANHIRHDRLRRAG